MPSKSPSGVDRLYERRWIAADQLPDELRSEIATDPTLEIRGKGSRTGLLFTALLPVGVAALVTGVLCALLVPTSLLGDPYRWASLIVAGLALGTWIAWRRAPSLRPFKGQALYVGPASLIIVDHAAVEILPAEGLELQEDAILCGDEVVDRGARLHVFRESLEAAIAAARDDEDARWNDPWRRAATAAKELPGPIGRAGKLLAGAGAGLALALALEAGAGVFGSGLASSANARWDGITTQLTEQLGAVSTVERQAHVQRLADATSTGDLLGVLEAIALNDAADERRKAILDRFSELARAELAAAKEAGETLPLMAVSRYFGLDDAVGDPAKARFVELARAEIGAASAAEDITWVFGVDVEYGIDPAFMTEARKRFVELADARMQSATSRDELRPLVGAVNQYELGDEIKERVTGRFEAVARTELTQATTTTELDGFMTDGLELRLDSAYLDEVRARYIVVARREMRAARTASSMSGLFGAARNWQLGDDVLAEVARRYEVLAGRDIAAAKQVTDLEPFVGVELRYGLSEDWEERVLEPRVDALIARDIATATEPGELAGAFQAINEFNAGPELRALAEKRYLDLGRVSIGSARAFLGWQGFDYMDETQQLTTELEEMCRRYPTKNRSGVTVPQLYSALLTGMCDDIPASLTYRLTSNTDDALGAEGAVAFRDLLHATSVELGAEIDFRMYPGAGSGDVLMSVIAHGAGRASKDHPAAIERDCTIKVTSQGSAGHRGTGLSETLEAVCVGMPEDDLE